MRTSQADAGLAAGRPFSGRRQAISENTTQRQGASDFRQEAKTKAPLTLSNASKVLSCPACGHPFRPKRKTQRACSRSCYLALWHFEELMKAIRADGLRPIIEELKKL